MLPKRQVAERLWDLIADRYRAPPAPRKATPPPTPPFVIVVHQADELRDTILQRRVAGDSVGFADDGHASRRSALSLSGARAAETGCVVVSSFVNPHAFTSSTRAIRACATTRATSRSSSTRRWTSPSSRGRHLYLPDDTTA